ncbi:MAG: hypothetical protein ACYDEX_24430, partial [Mobilitalea sp.]
SWKEPNCGKEDGIICGEKAWMTETCRVWVLLDDVAQKKTHYKTIQDMAREEVRRLKNKKRCEKNTVTTIHLGSYPKQIA